jgi:hypothetical protein
MHLRTTMLALAAPIVSLARGLYASIARLGLRHAAIFVVASFAVGQAINRFAPLNRFLLYQLLFIPAIVIAFAEIKIFVRSVGKYKTMTASHPTRDTGMFIANLLQSCWALPGLLTVSTLYIYATISLRYIALNPTGYYALVMICLVMLSAILGQTCYVYYLLLLHRVSASDAFKYNFYFPARTDWVQLLTQAGARLSNAFFVLGFIYTLVFFLNMPNSYVSISLHPWRLVLSTPNNRMFVASWLAIFVIVVLAFPIYAWTKARYLRILIRKLTDISIGEIEALIAESNLRGKGNVDAELKYYQLMANIENSSNEASNASNMLPVVLTICTIAVHLIKISESFSP